MGKSHGGSAARRRKQCVRSAREKAHNDGTMFRAALEKMFKLWANDTGAVYFPHYKQRIGRWKNPERWWRHNALVLDDGEFELRDEDVYDFKLDFADVDNFKRHTDMTINLVDVARAAKQKGSAHEIETHGKSRKAAIFLGDEEFEIWDDEVVERNEGWEDGWERIYNEERLDSRRTYSSVLRGNDS